MGVNACKNWFRDGLGEAECYRLFVTFALV